MNTHFSFILTVVSLLCISNLGRAENIRSVAEEIYDVVLLESWALEGEPRATSYQNERGESPQVNRERLKALEKFYQVNQGAPFHVYDVIEDQRKGLRNRALLKAVHSYLLNNWIQFSPVPVVQFLPNTNYYVTGYGSTLLTIESSPPSTCSSRILGFLELDFEIRSLSVSPPQMSIRTKEGYLIQVEAKSHDDLQVIGHRFL